MNDITAIALEIATKAHAGQVDKAGKPYIEHPVYVAAQMETEEEKAVALLHDVIEDTDYTAEKLLSDGVPQNVVDAVVAMTHKAGVDYFDYLKQVEKNPLSKKVKIQDILHNSDISRIDNPAPKDYKRLEKYKKALEYLSN